MRIALFSGTTEGRELSLSLAAAGHAVTVFVATEYGTEEQGEHAGIEVREGRIDREEMNGILPAFACCIDATHPYARVVTDNLRAAAEEAGVPYYRLKRAESRLEEDDPVITVATTEEAAAVIAGIDGNILLSTGAKEVGKYAPAGPERLYPRVLPSVQSIEACEAAGVPHRNIIAMQGPFTQERNEATIRQYNICALVTKDGGKAGGFRDKIEAARNTGIRVVLIGRPEEEGMNAAQILAVLEGEEK